MDTNNHPQPRPAPSSVHIETLVGGRGLQIAGLLSLLASAAFFLKLAIDHGWISPLERVIAGAIVGAVLFAFGARLPRGEAGQRAIAEGVVALGAAVLYLAAWAAGPVYDLVPTWGALAIMSAVTAVLATLAARRRSEVMALYGIIGGLITPALLPYADHQLMLASYLLALCGGMLRVATTMRFRYVMGVAFLGAFAYAPHFAIDDAVGWTYLHALVVSSAFFLEFGSALFFAARRSGQPALPDIILTVLNLCAYVASLQFVLIEHRLIDTIALLVLAGILGVVAARTTMTDVLRELYGWSAIVVTTIAMPTYFADSMYACGAAWAVEGMLLYGLGLRTSSRLRRLAGIALTAIGGTVGLLLSVQTNAVDVPIVGEHALALIAVVVALAGIALDVATYRDHLLESDEYRLGPIAACLATSITLLTIDLVAIGWWNTGSVTNYSLREAIVSVSWTIVAGAMFWFGLRRRSEFLRWIALTVFAITLIKIPLVDLATIDLIYRVGVLFATGTAALLVSAVYLRGVQAAPRSPETGVEASIELIA